MIAPDAKAKATRRATVDPAVTRRREEEALIMIQSECSLMKLAISINTDSLFRGGETLLGRSADRALVVSRQGIE